MECVSPELSSSLNMAEMSPLRLLYPPRPQAYNHHISSLSLSPFVNVTSPLTMSQHRKPHVWCQHRGGLGQGWQLKSCWSCTDRALLKNQGQWMELRVTIVWLTTSRASFQTLASQNRDELLLAWSSGREASPTPLDGVKLNVKGTFWEKWNIISSVVAKFRVKSKE